MRKDLYVVECGIVESVAAEGRQFQSGIASGGATAAEIDQHLGNLDAARLDLAITPMISAGGRKPR